MNKENNTNTVLTVENIYRDYSKFGSDRQSTQSIQVLKGLNFSIQNQEFVGIMGKSGCGKTTLLKILGLIDKPTKGKIFFFGKNTEQLWDDELADIRRRKIGFVFQDFYLMDSLTVKENIMLPKVLDKCATKDCMEVSERFAEHFGLTHLLHKYPYELSGGERQRVAISRALVNDPDVILADEPTGNLDSKSGDTVVKALENINASVGKTIIMVTHDPQVASNCSRVIFLKDGIILENLIRAGKKEDFYTEILHRMKEL